MPQFRCTRPGVYEEGCPGHKNPSARQGYYIEADNAEQAREIMERRHPGEKIDVQAWKTFTTPQYLKPKGGD